MSRTLPQGTAVVEVHLLGFPVELHAAAQQHSEELLREFTHIANAEPETVAHSPQRLLALVADLRSRYAPFSAAGDDQIEQGRAAGRRRLDIVYHVPPSAGEAAAELAACFEEADDFCRQGHLLTLAAPAELVTFRRWFLGEFSRQIAGQPARPWQGGAGCEPPR